MRNADLPECDPGEDRGNEQKQRRDELGRARAGRGRLGGMMSVVTGAMCSGRVRVIVRRVVIVSLRRAAARMPGTCAAQRNDRRDDAAEQREKNDRLIHQRALFSWRMILSENRCPLFGIMRYPFIRLMSSTAIEPRLR